MPTDGEEATPRVEFLSASEVQELDADPVLDRADYWERGRR